MKSWEIEIKILADDFGLPRSLVKSAIKKAELFKYFCLRNDIDTISSAHDKKNRYFSCLMTDQEFVEAKSFCDKFCKPEAEEKYNKEVICIIIEETRIIYV